MLDYRDQGRRDPLSRLVLASCSPRRCELLGRLGIPFVTVSPAVDETCSLPARDCVVELSLRKASAVAAAEPDAFIVAADTLVSVQSMKLGKPSSDDDAVRMLSLLSGQTHQVYTGVTVVSPSGMTVSGYDRTDVTFCSLPKDEILSYVHTGEPLDKAGGYALQGRASVWVTRIVGSDSSVIGLPLYLVREFLLKTGFPLVSSLIRD